MSFASRKDITFAILLLTLKMSAVKRTVLKTRITSLLKIQHPIVLPGMSWISVPKLVAAVSNAGGLGILATGKAYTI